MTCAQLLCSVVCCQSHHPAEKLLRIDTRSSGFADEEPNRSTRRYHACIRKYGFPTQDEPKKMKRRDDGCAEKDRQGPQVLGYAEWRVGAGEGISVGGSVGEGLGTTVGDGEGNGVGTRDGIGVGTG